MKYKIVALSSPEEWKNSLINFDHSYFHTWEYANLISTDSDKHVYLLLIYFEDIIVLTTYSIREKVENYKDIYTPYGYGGFIVNYLDKNVPLDLDKFKKGFSEIGRENNFITAYIMNHPSYKMDSNLAQLMSSHHKTYNWEISLSKEELWKGMNKGHKYEIKKAQKDSQLKIVSDKNKLQLPFIKLYNSTLDRVNASEVYYFNQNFLEKLTKSENSILVAIEKNGEVVVAILFLFHQEIGEYFISSATDENKGLTRYLIWETLDTLKEKGVRILNLGGGIKAGDSLDDFKRRFGAIPTDLTVLKYVFNQDKFDFLNNKFDSNPTNGYFPPYWKN